ncbi:hypothetical protein TVAG_392260 [Trichomonas vaginalis G3]|uniref:Uncharacterized protein n=1 Tax=Trichomonas vaginalis (strain ATCC PRA-98 / G3) TaxID=412133 RepID=A2DWS7_TRIV3|nr:hypothetical protein TVAGG3_0839600 [Trichomonas vaginalis G3]EAY15109.1 hypothetical protein TVAG_392260 [Trichomonas vaginalis G3]KAI5499199.1 hypothetical protein TVAGG3_0839600 [Trichomonas vaginalis G3]|eukprot:XP_001327332.1 hypothetical protein [Trichomonas vaginalis G3]
MSSSDYYDSDSDSDSEDRRDHNPSVFNPFIQRQIQSKTENKNNASDEETDKEIPAYTVSKFVHPYQLFLTEHDQEITEIAKQQNSDLLGKRIIALQQFAKLPPQEKEKYFAKVPIMMDPGQDLNRNNTTNPSNRSGTTYPYYTSNTKPINQDNKNIIPERSSKEPLSTQPTNNTQSPPSFFKSIPRQPPQNLPSQQIPITNQPINPNPTTQQEKVIEKHVKEVEKEIKPIQLSPKKEEEPQQIQEIENKLAEKEEVKEIKEKEEVEVNEEKEDVEENEEEVEEKPKIKKEKKHKHKSKHHHHKKKTIYTYTPYQNPFYFPSFQQPFGYYQNQQNVIVAVRKHPSSSSSSSSDSD